MRIKSKKFLFLLMICCFNACSSVLFAQKVKVTNGVAPCIFCLPDGWNKAPGSNFNPSISDMVAYGGGQGAPWDPSIQGTLPSGLGTFLTLYNSQSAIESSYTTITELTPGKTYYLKYSMMSSKADYHMGSTYGLSGTLSMSDGASGSQTVNFDSDVNTSVWLQKILKFNATSSNARLTFSGIAPAIGGSVSLDIGFNSLSECRSGTDQVSLNSNSVIVRCQSTGVDLNSLVSASAPGGSKLVWFTNPTHDGLKYEQAGSATPGSYYAFFYDSSYDCYNTDNSTAMVTVSTQPVPLKALSAEIHCPATTINLVTEFFGGLIPSGMELQFFDNPTHSGNPVNVNAPLGSYYAFFHDGASSCYNQDVSTAKVVATYKKCADLNPTVDIDSMNLNFGANRDFVVNLNEINGTATSGTVTFRLTKIGGFNITYPVTNGISNVFGGVQNENKNWTFSENANFITVTSESSIPANGAAVIGFNIQRKAGTPSAVTQNITPTVLSNAGGDINSKNNAAITNVSTN